MGRIKNTLQTLALAASLTFISCPFPSNPKINPPVIPPTAEKSSDYSLTNLSERILGSGYERPEGLSFNSVNNSPKSKGLSNSLEAIFVERPTYKSIEDETGASYQVFIKKPSIQNISETLQGALYEFPDSEINEFAICGFGYTDEQGNTFRRPRGLVLDSVLLKDNSVLFSSNISNKLFRIYNDGGVFKREIYKEDEELIGISDMILGSDGKVYIVQIPFYAHNYSSDLETPRPKRIMSIDSSKTLNLETELPDIISPNYLWSVPENRGKYSGLDFEIGEQIKITENSALGKQSNGIDFYVSDLAEKRIYKVSKKETGYDIDIFKELTSNPPTSIVVDNSGDLFVTTAPIFKRKLMVEGDRDWMVNELVYYPRLIKIDLKGIESEIHTFPLNFDFTNETIIERNIIIDGQDYIFPTVFCMSSALIEDAKSWKIYTTDSHSGEVNSLEAIKNYAPIIDITYPIDGTVYTSTNAPKSLECIVTDSENDSFSCEYSIDEGKTKVPFNYDGKPLEIGAVTGTNAWTIYAADSVGNKADKTVKFDVSQ